MTISEGQNSQFPPGTHVRLKDDPTQGGVVVEGPPIAMAGVHWLRIRLPNGEVRSVPEDQLEVVPAERESLIELLASGRCADPTWLRRALTRIRISGRLSDILYSMEATATDFYAYQFKPVLKILNSPTDSLLIADEVGLGKTIEAGLIWTELRARYDLRRLLVVCPKTLCEKWRLELAQRFGVDARVLDARGLHELLNSPFHRQRGFAAITWMQGLRPPRGWDNREEPANGYRAKLARFLDDHAEAEPLVDLLVIDEAHYMRNPETRTHELARLLDPVSSHKVFLSATPLHLRNRDLQALLKLLDPDTFERETAFNEILEANRPLTAARDAAIRPSSTPDDILEYLTRAEAHPLLADNQQIRLVRELLSDGKFDPQRRSAIAWRLEQANLLAHVVTRTRRRDIKERRVIREVRDASLQMSEPESNFYQAITEEVCLYADGLQVNERFLLSTPQRLLASSPAAAAAYWAGLRNGSSLEDEDEDDFDENDFDDRPLLERLHNVARQTGLADALAGSDTKYQQLKNLHSALKQEDPSAKLIVFSSFRITLEYLADRLRTDAIKVALLHGSIKDDRNAILQRFRDDPTIDILLSSEVGSEGIDLQFCWAIVNYDLPWNPMRVEQRIGRVDRIGQQHDKVIVYNLLHDDTIEGRIYQRLYRRLNLCTEALGEFEAVLGTPIREMTSVLMDPRLTPAQQEKQIEQTAQAIENARAETERLEGEAASLVAHGDYVLEKIRSDRALRRWIGGEEIYVYVRERLKESFPGTEIDPVSPGSDQFELRLSSDARTHFTDFLTKEHLQGQTKLIGGPAGLRLRFTPSVVPSSDRLVENVSQAHPLARFAAALDAAEQRNVRTAPVAAQLSAADAPEELKSGAYVVAIARWATTTEGPEQLGFRGYDLESSEPLPRDLAESLASATAASGTPMLNAAADPSIGAAALCLEKILTPALHKAFEDYLIERKAEVDDRAAVQLRTLERHLDNQTRRLLDIAERHQTRGRASLVRATEGRLKALKQRCEERRVQIESRRRFKPYFSEVGALYVRVR